MKISTEEDHRIRNALLIVQGNVEFMLEMIEFDLDACQAIKVGSQRMLTLLDEAEVCD